MDWRKFVDSVSAVEQTLREDPAGLLPKDDRPTRDHYRRTVERIARRGPLARAKWHARQIRLAKAGTGASDERTQHVGFYF